jgi:membrane complex biogenesis BtpA family protein
MVDVFQVPRALIGVIHLPALPGTPSASWSMDQILEVAVQEARVYHDCGFHAVIVENMHDRPYLNGGVGPEIVASMTAAVTEIARSCDLPLGVQVLAGANLESIAVAHASGAAFVRVEGFVFGHVADEGWMQSSAAELLRYRKAIGASSVRVLADIKKKHAAHAVTADIDLAATAKAAEYFLADGVIVTGTTTGMATDPRDVEAAAAAVSIPVMVGSGVGHGNVNDYPQASGLIVGSSVKTGGLWHQPLDRGLVERLARLFESE